MSSLPECDPSDEWLNFRLFTLELAILRGGGSIVVGGKDRSLMSEVDGFLIGHVISKFRDSDIGGHVLKKRVTSPAFRFLNERHYLI